MLPRCPILLAHLRCARSDVNSRARSPKGRRDHECEAVVDPGARREAGFRRRARGQGPAPLAGTSVIARMRSRVALAAITFGLCYTGVIVTLVATWANSYLYSYGFAVAFISGYRLWTTSGKLGTLDLVPDHLFGVPVTLAGIAMLAVGHLGIDAPPHERRRHHGVWEYPAGVEFDASRLKAIGFVRELVPLLRRRMPASPVGLARRRSERGRSLLSATHSVGGRRWAGASCFLGAALSVRWGGEPASGNTPQSECGNPPAFLPSPRARAAGRRLAPFSAG
jgi:hypothetical protein